MMCCETTLVSWIRTTNVENVESGTPSLYWTLKWIIAFYLFSCLRAGLTLVEFKGTYNKLDKSLRFLKFDWTKRKLVWKKICRKCPSCSSGTRRKLLGGGRLLGWFMELTMWLLSLWIGGRPLWNWRHQSRPVFSHSASTARSPLGPVALQLWHASRGRNKQINPWLIV